MKARIRFLLGLLLAFFLLPLAGGPRGAAQDLDPDNPPEPYTRYKLTVTAIPYGYTSGEGSYLPGTEVWISTSAYSIDYTFSHWELNGEYYGNEEYFYYTMPESKANFVAVYDFDPQDPAEPQPKYTHRIFLTTNMTPACSFNFSSGMKFDEETWVQVTAYVNQGYDFLGWYEGNTRVSEQPNFNYWMGSNNVTLEARFAYNPTDPAEPENTGQTDIANGIKGDVNGDKKVTVADAIAIIDYYLHWTEASDEDKKYDINKDGHVTVADAIDVITIYLSAN